MEKQAAETAMGDRISHLPIPILHQILCFLSQKEAVRTCLLSKQWRHLGSTRPNLHFSEEWFDGTPEKFPNLDFSEELFDDTQEKFVSVNCSSILHHILYHLCRPWRHRGSIRPNLPSSQKLFDTTQQNFISVVNRTLQGYLDQNLSIHKLHLHLSSPDSQPVISLLHKWFPIIAALNIKAFKLNFLSYTHDLPSAVFLAESLEELHLSNCKLSPVESVRFKCLRTLTLEKFKFDGGTFEKITWGCPLLRRLVLTNCWGLRNVRVSETASPGLKHFVLRDFERIEGRSIEIYVPNIETVSIWGPWIWSHRQSAFLFSRLTSLDLWNVILSSESFDLLSFGCPTLESLTLHDCSGFEEIHLASDSVEFLDISTRNIPLKGVTICAPNILYFAFTARIPQVPDIFSFTTTTCKQWESGIFLSSCEEDPDFDVNWWFLELRRMLKALSGSQISLTLWMNGGPQDVPCSAVLGDEPHVVLRNLNFGTCKNPTASWYLEFANGLFRVCRPSCIWGGSLVSGSDGKYRLSEFQLNMLLANKNVRTDPYFWGHDLEQVHVDGQLVQWTDQSDLQNRTYDGEIWLRLRWRDTRVVINVWAIGRDPSLWAEPENFWPERFLHDSVGLKGQFQFIPFGGGRRMCPGASFAMVIVELVLANLALNCEFELPVGLKGEDLDMSEGEGITIHRKFPLRVIANCES